MDEGIVKELARETQRLRRRLWLERSVFILLLVPMGTMWLLPRLAGEATAIQVDGRPVAVVESPAAAERVLETVKRHRAGDAAAEAVFGRPVTLTRAGRDAGVPVGEETAIRRLAAEVSVLAPRAVILVDGTPRVALPTEREAAAALALVKAHFAGQVDRLVEEPRFKQAVTIARREVPTELWKPNAEAAATFLREGPEGSPATHLIVPGDTASAIAEKYRLTLEELQRLNPGMRVSRLRVGETLSVRSPREAPVTVIVRARVQRLPRGLRVPGLRHGPAEVTYENGIPVAATAVTKTPRLDVPERPHAE